MKRVSIPGVVDIVSSGDAAEIQSLASDPNLDRAYANRSIPTNALIIRRICEVLQFGGKLFPTVSSRDAEGRAAAQDALWNRLNALAPALISGPDELESLAAFVRGVGSEDACGPLVQQAVGRLFAPAFSATPASWDAALLLDQATRTRNPTLILWWAATKRVDSARQLLADMVGADLAGMHAIGIAVHNIVKGVTQMRQLYSDPAQRATLSGEAVRAQCIFAPATVLRQPLVSEGSTQGQLEAGTLVLLNLQAANAQSPGEDLAFLRQSWSRCPAEQWVPALLEGIWSRARREAPQSQSNASTVGCPHVPGQPAS